MKLEGNGERGELRVYVSCVYKEETSNFLGPIQKSYTGGLGYRPVVNGDIFNVFVTQIPTRISIRPRRSAQCRFRLVIKDLGLYLLSPDRVSTYLAAASLRIDVSGSFATVHATPTSKLPLFLCDHTLPTPAAVTQDSGKTTLAHQHRQTGTRPPRTDGGLEQ